MLKTHQLSAGSICLFAYLSIAAYPAHANITNPVLNNDLGGITGVKPAEVFGRFIGSWWGVAYVSSGVIFLLYLVWGAIEMSIAGSNKDRVENAKNKIQNAFFGLALLAVSWSLVKAVGYVLGIDILDKMTFSLDRLAP